MIQSDEELAFVRGQLQRVEDALKAIRDGVRPANESRFLLMADSYVEMIHNLRSEIDAYLGLQAVAEAQAELVMGLEGRNIELGAVPASLVTRTVDAVLRGLQAVTEGIDSTGRPPRTAGRRGRWIEQLCNLSLAGLGHGTVKVYLGEPPSLGDALLETDERATFDEVMKLLKQGFAFAAGSAAAEDIPEGLRHTVLSAIQRMAPSQRGGLEAITLSGRAMGAQNSYRITRDARTRLRDAILRITAAEQVTSVDGVIREVDLDTNTFVLRERPESVPDLTCEYAEPDEDDVKSLLDRRVIVRGTLRTSPKTGGQRMEVEMIEGVEAEDP